jgi:hypothetical protein
VQICDLSEWLKQTRHDKRREDVLAEVPVTIGYLRQLVCYQKKGIFKGSISLLGRLCAATEKHTPDLIISLDKLSGHDNAASK